MKNTAPVLECIPNFSEGRDESIIDEIANAIRSVSTVKLLHVDASPAANRTVMTFAGEPSGVIEAAFKAIKKAGEVIDMTKQEGVHPRIGATDVCPLVPLYNMDMNDAIYYSNILANRVGEELNIPVYLYEHSAHENYRRTLPSIRKGQYEGMSQKIKSKGWRPDYGPADFNEKTGATIIGARHILVAFNIALNTNDVSIANSIAKRIRESGYTANENGVRKKQEGLLSKVRAIGWYMQDYELAQVSFNLLDHNTTSLLKVWQTCELLAKEMDVELMGSEVIGLLPEQCLTETDQYVEMIPTGMVKKEKQLLIHDAIAYLGLNKLKPFDPQEKVLEYALTNANLL